MTPGILVAIRVASVVLLGAAAVWLGGPLVEALFRRISHRDAPAGESPDVAAAAHVLQGGKWIGMVERLAVFASVVTGFTEGIAIALAIKGIGRYPELKTGSNAAAERFIIGTFISLLTACAFGGLARWLLLAS
ncbi:MAG: hypothetical protein WBL05_05175 [Brooklawnia sp.]|uniref:hypothetical protein n=1 Tax=Brooklawnia sp. TaxID=2699740 RepID=UPI003C724DDA